MAEKSDRNRSIIFTSVKHLGRAMRVTHHAFKFGFEFTKNAALCFSEIFGRRMGKNQRVRPHGDDLLLGTTTAHLIERKRFARVHFFHDPVDAATASDR